MRVDLLPFEGALAMTPTVLSDSRGDFWEWYRHEALREALGYPLNLAQANASTSARGVIRGIHYADVPPGQAKLVTCVNGSVLDVIVDLRRGSPTFGQVATVPLDAESHRSVYIGEGLGHGFCVLSETATVMYLCSTVYTPTAEHGISPMDPSLDLPWLSDPRLIPGPAILSDKDQSAPTLEQAIAADALPTWQQWRERVQALRDSASTLSK